MKKYSYPTLIILLPLIFTISCKNNDKIQFFNANKNSILPIFAVAYSYQDYAIYKIGVSSNTSRYSGFLNGGYFALKNHEIYNLFIDKRCLEDYKNVNYRINPHDTEIDSLGVHLCDISFNLYFNTDANVGDTMSVIQPEFDWVILKTKFIDTAINDTVYIYEKKVDINKYLGFSFSYSQGFMGLYVLKHYEKNQLAIENAYGKIYKDRLSTLYPSAIITYADSLPVIFKDIDLSVIKEFKD
jgi:hypothetical protein